MDRMSLFFAFVYIHVIKDMVHKDVALVQDIWEKTNEKQGQASVMAIKRYYKHHEDMNMG